MAAKVVPSDVVRLIDKVFPYAESNNMGTSLTLVPEVISNLRVVLEIAELIPDELITLSGEKYSAYVSSIADIHRVLGQTGKTEGIQQFYNINLVGLPAFGGKMPIVLIRSLLNECPDQVPNAAAQTLLFINDAAVRDGVRIDISAVHDAIATANWKAATVLGGAAVEAILLWAIQDSGQDVANSAAAPKGKDILRWDLADFIKVALEFSIISEETARQAELCRDARNLIHPGKMLRDRKECHRGTAFAAAAAIDCIVRDITLRRIG